MNQQDRGGGTLALGDAPDEVSRRACCVRSPEPPLRVP